MQEVEIEKFWGATKIRKNVDPKLYRTQKRCPSVRLSVSKSEHHFVFKAA